MPSATFVSRLLLSLPVLTLAVGSGCASRPAGRPAPPELPADAAWRTVSVETDPTGNEWTMRTLFVGRGEAFHYRVRNSGGFLIAICDGDECATTVPDDELQDPRDLDPRRSLRRLYDELPAGEYLGTVLVDDVPCWRWRTVWDRVGLEVWIDSRTSLPRRILAETPQGQRMDERYFDIAREIEVTPAFFDPSRLEKPAPSEGERP